MSKLSLAAMCVAVGLVAQAQGATVTATYTDNFSVAPGDALSSFGVRSDRGTTGVSPDTATSTWQTVSGGAQHIYTDNSWGVATCTTYLDATNLGGANTSDFSVSVNVTTPTGTGNAYRSATGLFALSDTTNTGGWSTSYYGAAVYAGWGGATGMAILHGMQYDYPAADATAVFDGGLAANTTYLMTLAGHYATGGLTLTFTVSEPGNASFTPASVSYTYADPVYTGNIFGIREDVQAGTTTMNFSNFALAVPEPTSIGFLALGGLALLRRRKA